MEPTVSEFDGIALRTADLAAGASFYRELLGLELSEQSEGAVSLVPVGYGGIPPVITLELDQGTRKGRSGIGGIHHFALGTRTRGSLLKWKRWLTDRGVPVSGPYDRGYFHSIYFRDPDGQVVEIATEGPGYGELADVGEPVGEEEPNPSILRGNRNEAEIAEETHPESVVRLDDEMALRGIHHVSGITDDLGAADGFYADLLGLSLIKRTVNRDDAGTPHWFWSGRAGNTTIPGSAMTLFGWPSHWNHTREGPGQSSGLRFRSPDRPDAWIERISRVVPAASAIPDPADPAVLTLTAPDGLRISIVSQEPAGSGPV